MKCLILLIIFAFASCSSQNHDLPDLQDSHDFDNVTDIDSQDAANDEIPDTDADEEECLPLLINAPFPYTDAEGNLTFCRPGCDTPTEKDPHCMTNLWKEQNEALCTQQPKYDCCGYPCVMESLKSLSKKEVEEMYTSVISMHKCDLKINPWEWGNDGTHGVVKSWNMSEGKVGFHLVPANLSMEEWPVQKKAVTYDIATRKYLFIAPQRTEMLSYHKGKRIALTGDTRTIDQFIDNIYLAYIGDDGTYELAYSKKIGYLPYEPALNNKWVFANIQEQNSTSKMMYAKVGEWKWTVIGEGTLRMSNLSGDRLALFTDDLIGYVCDLDESPQSVNDCYKINQGEEKVRYVVLDKENSDRVVYSSTLGKIVLMEYKNEKWQYIDIITSYSDEVKDYAIGFIVNMVRGNTMLYEEAYQLSSSTGHYGDKLCYYNFTSKKSYCMKKMEKDKEYNGITIYPYGDAEFEGKWLLYQKLNSTPLILRDMECYCKEEGVCPFEE